MFEVALRGLIGAVVVGGCAYFLLVLLSVRGFLARRSESPSKPSGALSFSLLKPLAGAEPDLNRNLESFYLLDSETYEVLCAARAADDPALSVARSLGVRYRAIRSAVLVAGEPSGHNPKVHSLAAMTGRARGEVLVISDSDIRTDRGLLASLAREFADPQVGVVTCPYRAVAGASAWSTLEALGINTEFWSGVLVAQLLFPMDFAIGPTMAVRRSCLDAIGGWEAVEDHLAEDFQIGKLARGAGFEVRLSTHVVEHRIGSQGFGSNLAHRLRWRRSTRRSRPAGYWGEVFANPLPWAVLLVPASEGAPWSWQLLGVCAALRLLVAIAVARLALGDREIARRWLLLPLQDVLSLFTWLGGFFGRRIVWRGRTYRLGKDGRLQRVAD